MLYRMLNILNTTPRSKNYSSGSKMLHTDIHSKADENIPKNHNNWCCLFQTAWLWVCCIFSLGSGKVSISEYGAELCLCIVCPLAKPMSIDWLLTPVPGVMRSLVQDLYIYTQTHTALEAFKIQWLFLRHLPKKMENKRNREGIWCFNCNSFSCSN